MVGIQDHATNVATRALIARRDEPSNSAFNDLSNVVPFARPSRHAGAAAIPLPSIAATDRPAPSSSRWGLPSQIALIVGSVALHGLVLAMFWRDPPPLASVGIESISAEMVLGADTAAGLSPAAGEQELQPTPAAEAVAPDEAVAEQSEAATVMPREVAVAVQETAPEARPQERPPEQPSAEPQPQEPPEPDMAVAEIPAEVRPQERPPERATPLEAQHVQEAPERKRIDAPTEKKPAEKRRVAAAPTDSASGIGRGRSDDSANYNGRVAAHLGRYKQYPAAARAAGVQGMATVSFGIDGTGRVTTISLARGSGVASIDHEVVAMVRRASPFPHPPDGRGRNFTVPVRFNLR
jgi:TonB family protein